jgi:hypothetical protein
MRYSPTTKCFYPEWGQYDNLPTDLIDATEEEFMLTVNRPINHRITVINGRVATEPIPPLPLAERQTAVWELIKAERDGRITGGVNVGGAWFHSDGYSRIQHLGLKDEVKDTTGTDTDHVVIDGEPVMWKTMSGAFVPMTRGLVKDIIKAVKTLDKRLFKAAEVHRAAMEASADPETYDFSSGWPARYEDAV